MTVRTLLKALSTMGENVRELDRDDILERLGLERRRGGLERALAAFGLFGAGIVVGAGVGMIVSPMAPADVRKKIAEGAKSVKKELKELVTSAEEQAHKGAQRVESLKNDVATSS